MDALAILRQIPKRAQVLVAHCDGRLRWRKMQWSRQLCLDRQHRWTLQHMLRTPRSLTIVCNITDRCNQCDIAKTLYQTAFKRQNYDNNTNLTGVKASKTFYQFEYYAQWSFCPHKKLPHATKPCKKLLQIIHIINKQGAYIGTLYYLYATYWWHNGHDRWYASRHENGPLERFTFVSFEIAHNIDALRNIKWPPSFPGSWQYHNQISYFKHWNDPHHSEYDVENIEYDVENIEYDEEYTGYDLF